MKKNFMMRAASVLLVAVMLTTCAISGTFAKYVTGATGSDTARVAKWGVKIAANGGAFGTAYKSDDGTISTVYEASTDSVWNDGTEDSKKLVAPGTNGSVVAMQITGKPEVDVEVKYEAVVTLTGWDAYCPIVFKVEDTTYAVLADTAVVAGENVVACANAAELASKVDAAIEACTANYEANTNLADVAVNVPNITWEWAYTSGAANDIKDTALGNAAAEGNPAHISVQVTTTVTQLD